METKSLKKYLSETGESQLAFAKRADISRSYLCEILSGERLPGRSVMEKISIATGGQVPPSMWFAHEAAHSQRMSA